MQPEWRAHRRNKSGYTLEQIADVIPKTIAEVEQIIRANELAAV